MPSAQVAMVAPSGTGSDRDAKPSPLGHFLSKWGRSRSKSPTMTISLKCKADTLPPMGTPQTSQQMPSPVLDEGSIRTPPPHKPKRNSSPFARVMNRLSMSRKHTNSLSSERVHDVGRDPSTAKSTISAFTTGVSPGNFSSSGNFSSPRPALSETDLRRITVTRGVGLSEMSPLSGAKPFQSEDNLLLSTARRAPSYLRVSCALNGYRQYRRPDNQATPLRTPARNLPLSNVQRRTLLFNNTEPARSDPVSSPSTHSDMGTPVRQLVARFDQLHLSSPAQSSEKENLSGKDGSSAHLTEQCDTLQHSVTPRSSMPLTSQIPNKWLTNPAPEPVIAQQVHSIIQRSTVTETKPHQNNQSEVLVNARHPDKVIMAERVVNGGEKGVELSSGLEYETLFDYTRKMLAERAHEALLILEQQENDMPEYAADALRSAAGNANLLLNKKMPRFAELLAKNLNPIEGDPQPAKLDDLAGYWALIDMEVDGVRKLFNEVEELKRNGWQKATTSAQNSPTHTPKQSIPKASARAKTTRAVQAVTSKAPSVNTEAKREADAKRRRDLAEAMRRQKERMMQEKHAGQQSSGFVC